MNNSVLKTGKLPPLDFKYLFELCNIMANMSITIFK